jgi:predicted small secreted protein
MKILAHVLLIAAALGLAACGTKEVSYGKDVKPVLEANCLECHIAPDGAGFQKTGLDLSTYGGLMKGTNFGPIVKPGDSFTSALVMLIEGRADPSIRMPHGKEPLRQKDIAAIKLWIDQGAKNN